MPILLVHIICWQRSQRATKYDSLQMKRIYHDIKSVNLHDRFYKSNRFIGSILLMFLFKMYFQLSKNATYYKKKHCDE